MVVVTAITVVVRVGVGFAVGTATNPAVEGVVSSPTGTSVGAQKTIA